MTVTDLQRPHGGAPARRGPRVLSADVATALACTAAGPAFLALAQALGSAGAATDLARLDQLLALACAAVGVALCVVWAVQLVVAGAWALAVHRGSRHRALLERLTPALLRRLAAAVFGLHVALAPAAAATAGPTAAWVPSSPTASAVDDGPSAHWLPTSPRPTGPGPAAPRRTPVAAPTVTVVDGDCLWDLAAAELGPDATLLEVDARWREWHRHNRDRIGDDPHLLHTGTVLEVPPHTGVLPYDEVE